MRVRLCLLLRTCLRAFVRLIFLVHAQARAERRPRRDVRGRQGRQEEGPHGRAAAAGAEAHGRAGRARRQRWYVYNLYLFTLKQYTHTTPCKGLNFSDTRTQTYTT